MTKLFDVLKNKSDFEDFIYEHFSGRNMYISFEMDNKNWHVNFEKGSFIAKSEETLCDREGHSIYSEKGDYIILQNKETFTIEFIRMELLTYEEHVLSRFANEESLSSDHFYDFCQIIGEIIKSN